MATPPNALHYESQLKLTVNAVTVIDCQFKTISHTRPAKGASTLEEGACEDIVVEIPGKTTAGKLTGVVWADRNAGGVTRELDLLLGQKVTYELIRHELDGTIATTYAGDAIVNTSTYSAPARPETHTIDLTLLTDTVTYPA